MSCCHSLLDVLLVIDTDTLYVAKCDTNSISRLSCEDMRYVSLTPLNSIHIQPTDWNSI